MNIRTILYVTLILGLFVLNSDFSTLMGEEGEYCKVCKNTGKKPIKPFCDTPDTLLDSERLNYPSRDFGLGWLPCEKGEEKHPELTRKAREEMELARKQLEAFLEGRQRIYDFLIFGPEYKKEKVNHIETDHFVIASTLEGEKIYKKKLTAHQRTRLYCLRLEECFEGFADLIGIEKSYISNAYGKWQILMWGKVEQQLKSAHKMVGNTQYPIATGNARLLTLTPFEPLPDGGGPAKVPDNKFYHNLFHNTIHLFFEEWGGWVDGSIPMWFYEGTSHFLEYRTFNEVMAYCSGEADSLDTAISTKWERNIYKLVKNEKDTPFPEMNGLKIADLKFYHRLKGWSIIDWLYQTKGSKKIQEFLVVLKKTKSESTAWRDVYELTIGEIDGLWRPWVLENYGPRKILKVEKDNEERLDKFIEHQLELIEKTPY